MRPLIFGMVVLLALSAAGSSAAPAPVDSSVDGTSVTVLIGGRSDADTTEVELRGQRVDGTGAPLVRTLVVPGTTLIELPDGGSWKLSIQSPRFWSLPVVASRGEAASIHLWPAGVLRGTVKTDRGRANIRSLRVMFTAAGDGARQKSPAGESACSVESESWRCLLPAGTHDLRLLSPGFAVEFRWKQEVAEAKETSIGEVRLRPGASLIGFVTTARDIHDNVDSVSVSARPRSVSPGGSGRNYTATVGRGGFFKLPGYLPVIITFRRWRSPASGPKNGW